MWPETSIGGIASATCGEGRFATQLCLSSGWQDPEYSLCSSGSTNVSCMLQTIAHWLDKNLHTFNFFPIASGGGPFPTFELSDLVNGTLLLNQGYPFAILCVLGNSAGRWIGPNGNEGTCCIIIAKYVI